MSRSSAQPAISAANQERLPKRHLWAEPLESRLLLSAASVTTMLSANANAYVEQTTPTANYGSSAEPAVAVAVPPQVELNPLGEATTRPDGSESVKATPVNPMKLFGFAMEKLTAAVPPGRIFAGVNALLMIEASGRKKTSRVAEAWLPVPPSFEVTWLVTLFLTPRGGASDGHAESAGSAPCERRACKADGWAS